MATDPARARSLEALAGSRALWNRSRLTLDSDEVLAQILDFGAIGDWRALFGLLRSAGEDGRLLRGRVHELIYRAPTGRPHFWLAVLAGLGHPIDWERPARRDHGEARL